MKNEGIEMPFAMDSYRNQDHMQIVIEVSSEGHR
jgi:hypothetical protein